MPAHGLEHFLYGTFHAGKRGARDDVVTDVELYDVRDVGDEPDVSVGQAVPGKDLQPKPGPAV